jgi:RNA polymerase sigma factor (sigma-70 family)
MTDKPSVPGGLSPDRPSREPEGASRSLAGPSEAEVREILTRNYEPIYSIVDRLARPYRGSLEVDELCQEVLTRLLDAPRRGIRFESDAHVLRYAVQVARNLLIDECRRRAVRKHQPLEADEGEPEAAAVPSPEAGPLDQLLASETDRRYEEAFERSLATLPEERMRRLVQMHLKGGLGLEELADEAQVSRATAYNWLSRFRSALRRELQGEKDADS